MVNKLRKTEQEAINKLAIMLNKQESEIKFIDIARTIAAFIRTEFKIKETRFEQFLFENNCSWNEVTCSQASLNGHIDCLIYAKTNKRVYLLLSNFRIK